MQDRNYYLVLFSATFQIQPFDAIRLDRRCRELSEEALGPLAKPAAEAARALAAVQNPVAVPYLAKVLRSGNFGREIAVRALASIANDEAVDALIGGLENPSEDVRLMTRDQLGRLEKRSDSRS